jgi:hypothetical protein
MPRRLPNLKTTLQRFRRKQPKEIEEEGRWFYQIINDEITRLSEFVEQKFDLFKNSDDFWKDKLLYGKNPIAFEQGITLSNLVRAVKHDLIEYFIYYYYEFAWDETLSKDEKDFITKELYNRLELYKHIAERYLDVYNQITTARDIYKDDIEFNRYVAFIKINLSESHKKYVKDFNNLNLYFSIVQAVEIVLNHINGKNKNIELLSYWNGLPPRDPDLEINIIPDNRTIEPFKKYIPPLQNDNLFEIRPTPSRNPLNSLPPKKNRRFLGKNKNKNKKKKQEIPKTFFMEENQDYLADIKKKWTLTKRDLNEFRKKLGEHAKKLFEILNPNVNHDNFVELHQDNIYTLRNDDDAFRESIKLQSIDSKKKYIDEITKYFLVITEHVFTYNNLEQLDEEEQQIYYINSILKQFYFLCQIALDFNNTSDVSKPIQLEKAYIIIKLMEDIISVSYKTAFAKMLKEFYISTKTVTSLKQWIPIIFQLDIHSDDELFTKYERNIDSNIDRAESNLILIKGANQRKKRKIVFKTNDDDNDEDDDDDDVPF